MNITPAFSAPQHVQGCTGKKAFETQQFAAKKAKWMRRKYDNRLAEYHCHSCRKWHIGELEQ